MNGYSYAALTFAYDAPGGMCKLAGKERDSESGLDNFGARYDSSSLGRFMSPDWSAKAESVPYADFRNPQSLNLYGYVKNNPLTFTDPDGHCCDWSDALDFTTGVLRGAGGWPQFQFGFELDFDGGCPMFVPHGRTWGFSVLSPAFADISGPSYIPKSSVHEINLHQWGSPPRVRRVAAPHPILPFALFHPRELCASFASTQSHFQLKPLQKKFTGATTCNPLTLW
jgi:RHS repeat-associated protein